MMDKKTLLLAQVFITLMMAASMSGIMSLLAVGPSAGWPLIWAKEFAIAWPIAFCLTFVASRIAFAMARRITRR